MGNFLGTSRLLSSSKVIVLSSSVCSSLTALFTTPPSLSLTPVEPSNPPLKKTHLHYSRGLGLGLLGSLHGGVDEEVAYWAI